MGRTTSSNRSRPNLAWLALFCFACSTEIAQGLEDAAANAVVVALEREGTGASKQPDPENEGKWSVTVPRWHRSHALVVLAQRNLPPPKRTGLLEIAQQKSLVPSVETEHVRLLVGAAQDLEGTLASIDRVVSARVHLAPGRRDPLTDVDMPESPSASVLIRYRGASSPIAAADVQRLVSGAVSVPPDRVNIVEIPAASEPESRPRPTWVGPLQLAPADASRLRWAIAVVIALNLAMLGLMIRFWIMARKQTSARTASTP